NGATPDALTRLKDLSLEQRARRASRALQRKKQSGTATARNRILRRSASQIAPPLSFAQQRLWFLDQLEPGSSAYNLPMSVSFKGRLRIDALEQTVSEIIRRHEILRTKFSMADGQPAQLISPAEPIRLPVTDLCEMAE